MPRNATAFALPAARKAKAAPELIGDDDLRFAAIASTLERSIADLSARLDEELLLNAREGQAALDRDQEVRRLNTRLTTLRRFGLDLCLGRMVPSDGSEPIYIGRLGLTGDDGERLLIDWRSPAAEPFFGATHANPLGLASRRRYRWTLGRITDYWDEVFTTDGLRDNAALDDQSAFIASLGTSRSPRMRDVLGTIQADQDAIIRAGSRGALVVDGGPGTGKTVVALHRAAYLLYSDPRLDRRHGGFLFVGPSAAYLSYVDDVLPSLGEDGVTTCTLRDLVPEGADAPPETDPDVLRVKSSARLFDALDTAVRRYEQPPTDSLLIDTAWGRTEIDADDWADAFGSRDEAVSHNEARAAVWQELLEIIMSRYDEEQAPRPLLRRVLLQDAGLRRTFSQAWPLLDPVGVVADLWSVPSYLKACAPWLADDEFRAVQRADGRAWTTSDLPFLDAARLLIGDPEAPARARRRAAVLAAQREEMQRVVEQLIASEELGDGDGNLAMLDGDDVRNALIDETAVELDDADELAGPFAHIVVDEAQELTDAQWRMLVRRCPSKSFTIVGDRAQARHGFTESWQDRLRRVGLDDIHISSLTINYRTPEEVMAVAEPVIRAVLPDANVPTSIRSSGIPVTRAPVAERDAILDEWLASNVEGIACVIGDPSFTARPRVLSLTPEGSKGLEFDLVMLADSDEPSTDIERVIDRYVAMTRTTQRLVLLTT
ncbi:MAG: RNA polymerase recycling motor ATPase HelR [Pseudolysinimonas sp.]|uniref:RNA polymerase recycling motor ATPase HelR n=1 Tax=Pseudolysinimonas sp. TaxID=2680009 RepID=UPI003266D0B3